jgi:hypothetical protein
VIAILSYSNCSQHRVARVLDGIDWVVSMRPDINVATIIRHKKRGSKYLYNFCGPLNKITQARSPKILSFSKDITNQ